LPWLRPRKGPFFFLALAALAGPAFGAEPSVSGQTGLISMPDARIAPEGSWRTGLSFMRPYQALWTSVALFPWLEPSARFTRIYHVPGFAENPEGFGAGYGDYKDKSFDLKLRAFPERGIWPAIALGVQDLGGGTGLFRGKYAAASKRLGELDLTLGYGRERFDGVFGGLRWTPSAAPSWSLVAEYDAYDYPKDRFADLSGAAAYKKDLALGLEYRWGWLGAQALSAHGNLGFNAYISVPMDEREFIPKIHEPAPYIKINPRPTEEQWHADEAHRKRLARALLDQDFRAVSLGYHHGRLEATLTNTRISSMPRAVGRAARTLLSFAPLEVREMQVTYLQGTLPVATYTFINVPLLQRYFNGLATREMLREYVSIEYADPQAMAEEADRAETLEAFEIPLPEGLVVDHEGADFVALRGENVFGGRLTVAPGFSTFFNDPGGAFRYDLSLLGTYDRSLGAQRFMQLELRVPLYEDVSAVTTPSNSELPHVRTDIAEYRRGSQFKLMRLSALQFYHPATRWYGRLSAGIYEEMFSGAGGQVLYLPRDGRWAADLDAHWVRQRDFEGWFGHQDYRTVVAIASLNYRMAQGVTGTLRAGRFLAKDEGVRVEVKRRFASGWEVGAWYTVTNGNDITSPGSPGNPYHDKGIFMVWQLDTLLTKDIQASATFGIAPWTRDVGQMLNSPGELYGILEGPVLRLHARDGLERFGDRDDDFDLPKLGADRRWPDFVGQDLRHARAAAGRIDWLESAALGAGVVLGSAALDDRAFRTAHRHRNSSWLRNGEKLGDALPLGAIGLSAIFAFDESRPQLSDAGVAALEAGTAAFLASTGLKYAVGRSRPEAGEGRSAFDPGSSEDRYQSFPSRQTAVMWAAVTPYAKEFDMPWLYGVAALVNAARVGSREHWLSDTVAGSVLGYALGHLAWEARRDSRLGKDGPSLVLGADKVGVKWTLE
jgi:membrane-associated phospholipid phosphatase